MMVRMYKSKRLLIKLAMLVPVHHLVLCHRWFAVRLTHTNARKD